MQPFPDVDEIVKRLMEAQLPEPISMLCKKVVLHHLGDWLTGWLTNWPTDWPTDNVHSTEYFILLFSSLGAVDIGAFKGSPTQFYRNHSRQL